jgi:NADH-quinone oxidoreductase subunit C
MFSLSQAVVSALTTRFADAGLVPVTASGDHGVIVPAAKLIEIATFLRDTPEMGFDLPVLVTCIDKLYLEGEGDRFEIVYMMRSLKHRHSVFLKVRVPETAPTLPSLTPLWTGFNWMERETFDMYGIRFEGHPDLRRIYMYDEFKGHPLRKDYPKEKRQPLVRRDFSDEPLSIDQVRARNTVQ